MQVVTFQKRGPCLPLPCVPSCQCVPGYASSLQTSQSQARDSGQRSLDMAWGRLLRAGGRGLQAPKAAGALLKLCIGLPCLHPNLAPMGAGRPRRPLATISCCHDMTSMASPSDLDEMLGVYGADLADLDTCRPLISTRLEHHPHSTPSYTEQALPVNLQRAVDAAAVSFTRGVAGKKPDDGDICGEG